MSFCVDFAGQIFEFTEEEEREVEMEVEGYSHLNLTSQIPFQNVSTLKLHTLNQKQQRLLLRGLCSLVLQYHMGKKLEHLQSLGENERKEKKAKLLVKQTEKERKGSSRVSYLF